MACILILECRDTCNCLQKNRCQIIYLQLCCCSFVWVWRGGGRSVADMFMLLDILSMAIIVRSDVGHRLFDSPVRYKKRNVLSVLTHLSKYKESLRTKKYTVYSRCLPSVLLQMKGGELWQRLFKFNVDDYKRRRRKDIHSFLQIWRV